MLETEVGGFSRVRLHGKVGIAGRVFTHSAGYRRRVRTLNVTFCSHIIHGHFTDAMDSVLLAVEHANAQPKDYFSTMRKWQHEAGTGQNSDSLMGGSSGYLSILTTLYLVRNMPRLARPSHYHSTIASPDHRRLSGPAPLLDLRLVREH